MTATQTTTYGGTRDRLLARLAERYPELAARGTDDFAIALLDGWAVLAEILGFHGARMHEESTLDLATELRSVHELAGLLGYRPDPGVAAAASLAFTVDDSIGAMAAVPIPRGTAVTSSPPPGEPPVTFETTEAVEGRPAWNALRPRLSVPQLPAALAGDVVLRLASGTSVLPGDGVLVPLGTDSAAAAFGLVTDVRVEPDEPPTILGQGRPGSTRVTLRVVSTRTVGGGLLTSHAAAPDLGRGPLVDQLIAVAGQHVSAADLQARAHLDGYAPADLFASLRATRRAPRRVLVYRAQTAILGSSAPDPESLPATLKGLLVTGKTWADDTLEKYPGAVLNQGEGRRVFCDSVVRGAGPGLVVLRDGPAWNVFQATEVRVASRSVFTVSGRGTVLTLATDDLSAYDIRGSSVYLAGEWVALAAQPDESLLPPAGTPGTGPLPLDDWVDGLRAGQYVAITGRSADQPGVAVAHVCALSGVSHDLGYTGGTSITLATELPSRLVRSTVRINANVAPATHGETRTEVLGSGDARVRFPSFTLSAAPLTYVSAAGGSVSTLAVYVDGVRRPEVTALLDPDERGYLVRHDDQGRATVQFGAPLPTGQLNVRAVYRVGVGPGAAVGAGQLTLLRQRPPGVTGVVNPLAATGGAAFEPVELAQHNAPVKVRSLGRLVALDDYADFALAFPGIAKASAARDRLAGGVGGVGVLVTVAGPLGDAVPATSKLRESLLAGLQGAGDPLVPVRLASYTPRTFRVVAALRLDPGRIPDAVRSAARAALAHAFGFDARSFGQPVAASEVVSVLQAVDGVRAAHLVQLQLMVPGAPVYQPFLAAALTPVVATTSGSALGPAELLTIEAGAPDLQVVTE